MKQEEGKYLYIPYTGHGGIDTCISSLRQPIQVALSMERIPIIMKNLSDSAHRLDELNKETVVDWKQYFDLSKTRIFKIGTNGSIKELSDTLQYVYEQDFDFGSYSNNQIRYINSTQIYDRENEDYPIVCMLNPGQNAIELGETIRADLHFGFEPSFLLVFSPSQRVNDLTDIVLGYFGVTRKATKFLSRILYELPRVRYADTEFCYEGFNHYACMHVRYEGDINMTSKILNKSLDLRESVKKVCKIVYERNNKAMPLYIMSNVMNANYFDFLRPQYDIYKYTDFKELREQFKEKEEIDHNLLFMVEQNIMRHATVRIWPRGRNRFVFEYPWLHVKSAFERIF